MKQRTEYGTADTPAVSAENRPAASARRARIVFICAAVLLLVLAAVSVCIGSYPLTVSEVGAFLVGNRTGTLSEAVFFRLRLPRILMGILCGAVLGITGGVYQMVFESPLASPDLTGVSSGASLGAAAAIALGCGGAVRVGAAFLGGLLALGFVLLLLSAARGANVYRCILAGVIVSSAADAGLMLMKSALDREGTLSAVEFFTMGSLGGITDRKVLYAACAALPALLLLLCFERQASMLSLGALPSRTMGVSPAFWRIVLLALSTLAVAAVVSVCGTVGFLGLTAPHIARLLRGRQGKGFLLLCACTGADLLLCADLLARSVSPGEELPLGVFTVAFALPVLSGLLFAGGGADRA